MSLKSVIKYILEGDKKKIRKKTSEFVSDLNGSIRTRHYDDYSSYVMHQSEKLNKQIMQIRLYDIDYEKVVFERYKNMFDIKEKSILCLAARLGGEVRAFKRIGALAIGVDLEPGDNNLHVLKGDFHNLQFADNTFDFAFTNAIDHVYDIEKYLLEVKRILKRNGCFIVEFAEVSPGEYEVIDTRDIKPILAILRSHFTLLKMTEITNKAGFANWSGKLIVLLNK